MKHFKRMLLLAFFAVSALLLPSKTWAAAVEILETGGWFESGYVTWSAYDGAIDYNVYVKASSASDWTQLDRELVRQYPNYYRADALGLKAGDYQFKVEPVTASGAVAADAATSSAFTATAHDRSGFAHVGMSEGIGAYKNDGTLKDDAKVLYVWADNAKTVSTTVKTGSKDTNIETFTGLQAICDAYQKGWDTTPLAIRIIGTIKSGNMDKLSSSEEGLQVKGKGAYSLMPITIEGVGYDAAIHGFGILVRNCKSTEFRNFAIMNCMDDCLSIDTKNSNVWIHNMDFFYGATGGDADQAKGDGTVDIKGHSMNVTVSYNHFYDSGKCSLGGMTNDEETDAWHTYHHNWFDHSDSRHPRIRVQFFHVYNNYYDGNSKYGVGMTSGGSALVENNYFRNCKYPMLTSKQGTDAEGAGTFSGEPGGVIKAFNNILVNPRKIQYNTGAMTDGKWDAVLVESRDAEVTATCLAGGTGYNSVADLAARTSYIENKIEAPETVVATVTGSLGAGRMQHGDFTWKFLNSAQDENDKVIVDLKTAFNNYKSTLEGFANGDVVSNGGATQPIKGGDGLDVSDEVNNAHVPSWGTGTIVTDGDGAGGGSGSADPSDAEAAIIGAEGDYFWFNADNEAATNAYIADGTITLNTGSSFNPTVIVKNSSGTSFSDKTGSLQLATSSGTATFYNADGITKMCFYLARTGSMSGKVQGSNDNETYTDIQSYSANKGTYELTVSSAANYKYYRITNTASGSLHVQGIKLYKYVDNTGLLDSDLTAVYTTISLNLGKTRQLTTDDYTTSSTGAVTYASGKTAVATVSASGLITAVAEGTATITISQAKDETYKSGTATISVTVVDNRAESTLALTSEAAVSIEEGEASQITISGAAGAVTYKSSKTSVATVDGTGKITAVAEGTATITITDAGSETVKGGSLTVAVTVTAQPGSGDDDPEDPTASDEVVCHFTGKAISSDMVKKVVGSFSDSKGSVTYNDITYKICIKMESNTQITITPDFDCKITLVFDLASKELKLDGTTYTTDANNLYTFIAKANTTYTLAKGDTMNLFLVIFTPAQDMNLTAKEDPMNAGAYYATFFSSLSAYTLPADVTAYIATMDADGQSITLHAIDGDVVPKSEAVLIKASNASVTLTKSDSDASKSQDNVFEGADLETAQAAGKDYYVLSGNATHGVGFYHLAAGNKLGANKAFIAVDASSASPARLNFSFEGEGAESLPAIEQNPDTEVIYGLDGQRRSAQQKGFSIVNGKKVFVM